MNRAFNLIGVLLALVTVFFLLKPAGAVRQPLATVPTQTVAPDTGSAAASDSSTAAIDALAAWPASAVR